jgi:hypothetical protein
MHWIAWSSDCYTKCVRAAFPADSLRAEVQMFRILSWLAMTLLTLLIVPPGAALAKDGIVEINGVVQSRPAGPLGDWSVAGRVVRTDAATIFKEELGPASVGAVVEVKGTLLADGVVLAQRIEVKQPAGNSVPPPGQIQGEVTGTVEALPASGLSGKWMIAGRTVLVLTTTQINQEHGGVAIGAVVEVHGTLNADQSITATRIEVKASAVASANPGVPQVELLGRIDSLPAGLLGSWAVAGRSVLVNAATLLNAEHGTFAVGATVEVHAAKGDDGALTAVKIELKPGIGAAVPSARFWGRITALPATGLIGLWKIDNAVTVDVGPATAIRVNDGPMVVGAIVEVSGWPQPDGVVVASEIETRAALGQLAAQGTTVVEYGNAQLGHYFMTASTAEIATLDAGAFVGAWRRTGQTFRTGGTQAVCRFYGMPPRGPDSHFFTADAAECEHVMGAFSAWTFEDHAFAITPAITGQCPAGMLPVHRFYNNPARADDMNHRFTVTSAAFDETVAMGWVHEGVVMCAQR